MIVPTSQVSIAPSTQLLLQSSLQLVSSCRLIDGSLDLLLLLTRQLRSRVLEDCQALNLCACVPRSPSQCPPPSSPPSSNRTPGVARAVVVVSPLHSRTEAARPASGLLLSNCACWCLRHQTPQASRPAQGPASLTSVHPLCASRSSRIASGSSRHGTSEHPCTRSIPNSDPTTSTPQVAP